MNHLSIKLILLFAAFICGPAVFGEEPQGGAVYKEIGEDGIPSFSDQAMPGAEPVEIRQPVVFKDEAYQRNRLERSSNDPVEPKPVKYELLITDPPDGAAIRDNAGNLDLTISISPSIQKGHRAELLMDGNMIRNVGTGGTISLTNVDRGMHAFSIQVLDKTGKVLTTGPTSHISILRYHKPPP